MFSDQSGQFGDQAGDMQIGEVVLTVDTAKPRIFPVGRFSPAGQGGLPAEFLRQIPLGGRFQSLLADGFRQQAEKGQYRCLRVCVEYRGESDHFRRCKREVQHAVHLFRRQTMKLIDRRLISLLRMVLDKFLDLGK